MSLYQTQKLLFNLHNRLELRSAFKTEPQKILQDYDLTENERQAILNADIATLYRMGVNAWLLFQFSHLAEIGREDYLKQIKGN